MTENERFKEMIKFLIDSKRVRNQQQFTEEIRSDKATVSEIKTGKRKIPNNMFDKIEKVYPEICTDWLLTGKGEMLKEPDESSAFSINKSGEGAPYYNVDFMCGFDLIENDQTILPEYHIKFPKYKEATVWVNVSGNSMYPLISHGDIVALRKIDDWWEKILYGEVYAVVTEDFRTIKKIRKSSKGSDYLRFVPENVSEFDEQDVRIDSISIVYKVLGCAKIM